IWDLTTSVGRAFLAALSWRNEIEAEIGKPRTDRQVIGTARSNTGHVGISRRGHTLFIHWKDVDGTLLHTSVSMNKHGVRAMKLGRAIRYMGERDRDAFAGVQHG